MSVGHFLQPVDRLAIERLGDGDVRHPGGRRCAVPMFLARRNPDDIAGSDVLLGAALRLHPAQAGSDDQGLAQRTRMPGRSCARLEITIAPPMRAGAVPLKRMSIRTSPVKYSAGPFANG
jgi:hypothetical protein